MLTALGVGASTSITALTHGITLASAGTLWSGAETEQNAVTLATDPFTSFPQRPGYVEGISTTTLSVSLPTQSNELNARSSDTSSSLTVSASRPVTGALNVLPGMIEIMLSGQGITELTLSGLVPQKEYHLYRNHYGEHTSFTPEGTTYTFSIDLTEHQFVFIQYDLRKRPRYPQSDVLRFLFIPTHPGT